MWPFKTQKSDTERLLECIQKTKKRIEGSDDSVWTSITCLEVVEHLAKAEKNISAGKEYDERHLSMLFAPTGPIQEISIENGWGDEFLNLSSNFDLLNKR